MLSKGLIGSRGAGGGAGGRCSIWGGMERGAEWLGTALSWDFWDPLEPTPLMHQGKKLCAMQELSRQRSLLAKNLSQELSCASLPGGPGRMSLGPRHPRWHRGTCRLCPAPRGDALPEGPRQEPNWGWILTLKVGFLKGTTAFACCRANYYANSC